MGRRPSIIRQKDQTLPAALKPEVARKIGLIGKSLGHQQLLTCICKTSQVNAELFLVGETGVGKELYARYAHRCSPRSGKAFIAVNCGAIPEALFENELFGHSAGAYTDARSRSEGLVAAAEGGTIFLDEVGSLAPSSQAKLLRLLQEREYRRLGETRIRRADFRVISAMNVDPEISIAQGQLRADLYYRLNVVQQRVQPLRDRAEDIGLLLRYFCRRYSREYQKEPPVKFSPKAARLVQRYHWPGNVRQLQNFVRGLICQCDAPVVRASMLNFDDDNGPKPADGNQEQLESNPSIGELPFNEAKRRVVDKFEREYLQTMLRRTNGNVTQAAKLSGKDPRAFRLLMQKRGVDASQFR